MNKLPANILTELIEVYGEKLIKEPKRCEALLHDKCENQYRREIFVLIKAIKEGIPTELLNTPQIDEVLFIRLVRRFCEKFGLNKVAGIWAVSTWVLALKKELIITKTTPKPPLPPKPKSLPKLQSSLPKPPPLPALPALPARGTKLTMIGIFSIVIIGILIIIALQEPEKLLELNQIQQQIIQEKARLVAIQKEINRTIAEREKVLTQYNQDKQFKKVCENAQLQQPEMVKIPEGKFLMGNIQGKGNPDEQPVHWVKIPSFSIGRYEITFEEYDHFAKAVGKTTPNSSGWKRANHPVINISWHDAVAYANCLSLQTGYKYRLPTEAEWEYAARAGTMTQYSWSNKIGINKANCSECSPLPKNQTMPVDSLKPNSFGLYNMQGNVSEWTCSEADNKYRGKEQQCVKPNEQQTIIIRGGSWKSSAKEIRTSARASALPNERNNTLGFRLVKE
jgi:formylglycine-generating enzyme required for sulfatase activity